MGHGRARKVQGVGSKFLSGAKGRFVVYDVTNMESFLNLPTWLEEVERHTGPDVTKVDFVLET